MSSATMTAFEEQLRQKMKDMLWQCTPQQREIFQKMYDHKMKYAHPVDGIPFERLDWAFKQIEKTLADNAKAER